MNDPTKKTNGNETNRTHRLESPDGRLEVEYQWQVDRFVHRILVDGEVTATSIDGNASQDWPPSPPIQQISLESIDGVPTILGVGGAGRGHWSISVGWIKKDQTDGHFRFDIACRTKDEFDFLGSTYRGTVSAESADTGSGEPKTVCGGLTIDTPIGERHIDGQRFLVRANSGGSSDTRRWVYDISIDSRNAQGGSEQRT